MYKHEMKPLIERLLAQMELILLTGMEEVADGGQEDEWNDAEYPALVMRLFINKRGGIREMDVGRGKPRGIGGSVAGHATGGGQAEDEAIHGGEKHPRGN